MKRAVRQFWPFPDDDHWHYYGNAWIESEPYPTYVAAQEALRLRLKTKGGDPSVPDRLRGRKTVERY